jgi:dihydrofolate synthase / folylpolyglutamate synthase
VDESINKRISNIQDAINFVYSFINYEKKNDFTYNTKTFDIEKFDEFLIGLDSPHLKIKTVHVVGTKGKGSTSAILSSILTHAGYKVGSFTSPHLEKINERICLNGKPISDHKFTSIVEKLRNHIISRNVVLAKNFRTTFELLTATAFIFFADEKVDYAVIEAGLGGRLDATNVIKPKVVLITSISLDHTNVLGETIEKIAYEKGGVIKASIPVFSSNQQDIVKNVLQDISNKKNTRIEFLKKENLIKNLKLSKNGTSFDYEDGDLNFQALTLPLLGDYQVDNASLAIKSFYSLCCNDVTNSKEAIRNGLSNVKWRGRMDILSTNPLVIADVAHNPDSIRKMLNNLKSIFEFKKILCVLSISTNKDIPEICKILSGFCSHFYVTFAEPSRSAHHESIQKNLAIYQNLIYSEENPEKALFKALNDADNDDLVLITGSVYLVGSLLSYFDHDK